MIYAERPNINLRDRIKFSAPYAAYLLALSEAHSASGPALA